MTTTAVLDLFLGGCSSRTASAGAHCGYQQNSPLATDYRLLRSTSSRSSWKNSWRSSCNANTRSPFGVVLDSSSCVRGRSKENSNSMVVTGGARGAEGIEATDEEQLVQSRRAVVCLLASISLSVVGSDAASAAFSPGFPGMKDWLKGQKQKTASFVLAPINASRDRLSTALLLITADDVSSTSYEEAENLVKVAARDCMPLDAGSILDFQSRSGVEVCTFKLVLKNAASLLDNSDPAKLNAEELLKDLIRSFVALDQILGSGASGGSPDRKNLMGALAQTSAALDHFEGGVRACLGIA